MFSLVVALLASPVGAARVQVDMADEGKAADMVADMDADMVADNWCDDLPNPALLRSFGSQSSSGRIGSLSPVLWAEDFRLIGISDPYARMGARAASYGVSGDYEDNDEYWWVVECGRCSRNLASSCTFTSPRSGRRLFYTRVQYLQRRLANRNGYQSNDLVGAGASRVMGSNQDQFFNLFRTDDGKYHIKTRFDEYLSAVNGVLHGEPDDSPSSSLQYQQQRNTVYMSEPRDGDNVWPEELWSIDPVPGLGECAPVSTSSHDAGYIDAYQGWYDLQGCGQCNDYCRWIGGEEVGSGGNPARSLENGESWWSCRLAGSDDAYTPRGHFTSFAYTKCEAVPATRN